MKTKPLLTRPGADFCHTPSFGALTAAKSVAGAMRAKRSKRIHMRFVPATAGIDPTKVAVRCGRRRPALARGELGPQRRRLGLRAGGQREQATSVTVEALTAPAWRQQEQPVRREMLRAARSGDAQVTW